MSVRKYPCVYIGSVIYKIYMYIHTYMCIYLSVYLFYVGIYTQGT